MEEVRYELRNLSDHSPAVFSVKRGNSYSSDWRINAFWLELIEDSGKITASLEEFKELNAQSALLGVIWDTLNVFLRGVLIEQISQVKKQTKLKETIAGENARNTKR